MSDLQSEMDSAAGMHSTGSGDKSAAEIIMDYEQITTKVNRSLSHHESKLATHQGKTYSFHCITSLK